MRLYGIVVLICLLAAGGGAPLYGENGGSLIPDDVPLVAGTKDLSSLVSGLKESSLGALFSSPQMKSFMNNRGLSDLLVPLMISGDIGEKGDRKALLQVIDRYISLFTGELTVGLGSGGSGEFYLIGRMGERNYRKSLELDEYLRRLLNQPETERGYRYRGQPVHRWIGGNRRKDLTLWKSWIRDTVIIGSRSRWIEECIVRIPMERRDVSPNDAMCYFRIGEPFIRNLVGGNRKELSAPYSALGLDELRRLDLRWSFGSDGIFMGADIVFRNRDRGIWRLLSGYPLPVYRRLMAVPAHIHSYQVARLDLDAFWEGLPEMLNDIDPGASFHVMGLLKLLAESSQTHPEEDLIGNLESLVVGYSRVVNGHKRFLYGIPLKYPVAAMMFLDKIFFERGFLRMIFRDAVGAEPVHGTMLYTIRSAAPALSGPADGDKRLSVSGENVLGVSVSDGLLLLGSRILVREYLERSPLNGKGNSYYDSPQFRTGIRNVPDDAVSYSVFDTLNWFSRLEQFINRREPERKRKKRRTPMSDTVTFLKSRRLPPAAFIASYFGTAVGYSRLRGGHLSVNYLIMSSGKR